MRLASGSDKNTAPSTSYVFRAPDRMRSYSPDFSQLFQYYLFNGMADELTHYKQSINWKSSRFNPIIDTGSKSDHEKSLRSNHPNTANRTKTN